MANRPFSRTMRHAVLLALPAMLELASSVPLAAAPPPPSDWQDAPITPGEWRWGSEGGVSTARFTTAGASIATLRCVQAPGWAAKAVTLQLVQPSLVRAGTSAAVTVATTALTRPLFARVQAGAPLTVTFAANDSLLDAMAFSRGRFMVAVEGMAPLYLPAWPEVARVIEDCRS